MSKTRSGETSSKTIIPSSCTERCAQFSFNLQYEDLPLSVIEQVKLLSLDWLACAIQGARSPYAQAAKRYLSFVEGAAQASVIDDFKQSNIFDASFYNAYIGHIMEMDDVDKESITHPATVIIPAALAVGEYKKSCAKDVITAIVAAYEVMLRVGAAITPKHYEIWHTTATSGAFGSAIAASKLFHLSKEQTSWSLGNAGTMAAGLWQFLNTGAMSKFLHTGKAASNGVLAAFLAHENFTGATDILEGKQGFFAGFARQEVDYSIFSDFGKRFRTDTVSIKPYPCCRHTHSSIDAAIDLYSQNPHKTIKTVLVEVYQTALNVAGNPHPTTPQEAKFSLKYCVARTLQKGAIGQEDFTQDLIKNRELQALMDKITVQESPKLSECMPKMWPSIITITYSDGTSSSSRVDTPKGDPENPVSWDEGLEKFRMMTEGLLQENTLEKVSSLIKNLEKLENIGQLIPSINTMLKQ